MVAATALVAAVGACDSGDPPTQPSAPQIGLAPTSLTFSATQGGVNPASQQVVISNAGDGTLSGLSVGTISYGAGASSWLQPPALSATSAPATLTVQPVTGILGPGTYTATVPIVSAVTGNSARDLTVTLTVRTAPQIGLAPTSLTFSATQGGVNPASQQVVISNAGDGTLSGLSVGTISYGAGASSWLQPPTLSATSAPATLTVQPVTGSLGPGTYTATVPIVSAVTSNSSRDLTVTLTVRTAPQIGLAPTSLTFSATQGGVNPASQQVVISNAGDGTLSGLSVGTISYGAGASGWLQPPTLSATSAPATLTVQAVTGILGPGTYTATVPIVSAVASNSPRDLTVTFTVTDAGVCAAPVPAGSAPFPSTTNVLVDLSHEFTFVYDIFAHHPPYWDAGFSRTSVHADLASASVDLDDYDIAIIHQGETGVAFGEDEMQRLQQWVRDSGGRLVLVARGTADLPLAQLAARFGIDFSRTTVARPYEVKTHPATSGVSEFIAANGALPATVVRSSCACDTLVTDARQQPVVLACLQGAGKVVAISEPAFIANPYAQEIINVQFTKQLMAWLGPRNRAEATVAFRIMPDLEKPLSGDAKLLYTARTASSPFVSTVEAQHAQVDQELQRITGLQNVFPMTFLALPCSGGGYSGGSEVGVCGFGDTGGMTLVLAHELMHSFDIPNPPPEMMHPVVSYVATLVGAALGGSAATTAAAEKQAWDAGFKAADPTGTTLDVTNDALFDRRGKMYWIMGRLDGTYPFATTNLYDFPTAARDPGSFLKRYYQRKRADSGYTATPTNIVRLLSIAACRDLFPDFRAVGTTLDPTPAGLAAEIAAACSGY